MIKSESFKVRHSGSSPRREGVGWFWWDVVERFLAWTGSRQVCIILGYSRLTTYQYWYVFVFLCGPVSQKHPHISKHTLTQTLIVTLSTEGSRYLYGNRFCSHLSLNFHTLTFSLSRYVQLSAEHGFLVFKRPRIFPASHANVIWFFFFFSPIQVWTEPAPFLVRPITTKAWPRLDLAPSPVGVQQHFSPFSSYSFVFYPYSLCVLCLSLFSSSVPASQAESCGDHSD